MNVEDLERRITRWEGRSIGKATGHAEIRALFEGFQQMMSFTQHMVVNPIIEVDDDGQHAKGRWYFFGPFTFNEGKQAYSSARRYPLIPPR